MFASMFFRSVGRSVGFGERGRASAKCTNYARAGAFSRNAFQRVHIKYLFNYHTVHTGHSTRKCTECVCVVTAMILICIGTIQSAVRRFVWLQSTQILANHHHYYTSEAQYSQTSCEKPIIMHLCVFHYPKARNTFQLANAEFGMVNARWKYIFVQHEMH